MNALFLLLLVIGTARWSAGYTPTPYTVDNCNGDSAIRFDGNITHQGVQVNEFHRHDFDLSSEEEAKPRLLIERWDSSHLWGVFDVRMNSVQI